MTQHQALEADDIGNPIPVPVAGAPKPAPPPKPVGAGNPIPVPAVGAPKPIPKGAVVGAKKVAADAGAPKAAEGWLPKAPPPKAPPQLAITRQQAVTFVLARCDIVFLWVAHYGFAYIYPRKCAVCGARLEWCRGCVHVMRNTMHVLSYAGEWREGTHMSSLGTLSKMRRKNVKTEPFRLKPNSLKLNTRISRLCSIRNTQEQKVTIYKPRGSSYPWK